MHHRVTGAGTRLNVGSGKNGRLDGSLAEAQVVKVEHDLEGGRVDGKSNARGVGTNVKSLDNISSELQLGEVVGRSETGRRVDDEGEIDLRCIPSKSASIFA